MPTLHGSFISGILSTLCIESHREFSLRNFNSGIRNFFLLLKWREVSLRSVRLHGGRRGRSPECPAIPPEVAESVINRIKGDSLGLYP